MSDREQAIEEFADACGYPAETVAEVIDDEHDGAHKSTIYAVSQRERVIALERALREIIDMPHGETICCDMEAIAYAALNGESK